MPVVRGKDPARSTRPFFHIVECWTMTMVGGPRSAREAVSRDLGKPSEVVPLDLVPHCKVYPSCEVESGRREMRIGELAEEAGVTTQTIRYYERRGLLREPSRSTSGYREYDRAAQRRLQFVLRAKDLGFSLGEIGDLLDLHVRPGRTPDDVRELALQKVARVERKLRELEGIREALVGLVARCEAGDAPGSCALMHTLGAQHHS